MRIGLTIVALSAVTYYWSHAQEQELSDNLRGVADRLRSAQSMRVSQRYTFSYDSLMATPFDSGHCAIHKRGNVVYVDFSGVEMYTDGNYIVRVSNPSQLMVVSFAKGSIDVAQVVEMFSPYVAGFEKLRINHQGGSVLQYALSGGRFGTRAITIEIDTTFRQLVGVVMEVSGDNPILAQLFVSPTAKRKPVFIRIDYSYSYLDNSHIPSLTDYLTDDDGFYAPSSKYAGYQLQVID